MFRIRLTLNPMRFVLNPLCGNEAGLSCLDALIGYSINSIKNEIRPNELRILVRLFGIKAISNIIGGKSYLKKLSGVISERVIFFIIRRNRILTCKYWDIGTCCKRYSYPESYMP